MFDTSSGARAPFHVLAAVGAGAAALACGSPPAVDRHEDPETSVETVTASPELGVWVESAVERWSVATGRSWSYGGNTLQDSGADFHIAPGEPPPGYVAFAYGNGRIVVSPAWVNSSLISTVLMHELGHAFRGDHHEGGGVMYYALGDGVMTSCLTPADLVWACRDFECTGFASECEQPELAKVEQPEMARCFSASDRLETSTRLQAQPSPASGWLAASSGPPH